MNLATLMTCATCHEPLTEHRNGGYVSFRHPVADKRHEAVPMDAGHMEQVKILDRCHICSDQLPVWDYRTGLIQLMALDTGVTRTYNDHWHVCYGCARLIEADDSEALTARSADRVGWRSGSTEYVQLNLLHRGIVIGREGRTLLTTTQWPAARISADMLPKIRDRFTGLLRGPADLPSPINDPRLRKNLADQLDLASMYWINEEFTGLVRAVSADQPVARINDDIVPSAAGLIAWPEPVGTQSLAAASWTPHADGWHIIGYRSVGSALAEDLMPTLRHEIGWLIPTHSEQLGARANLDGSHPLGPLITTWLLINQRMAESVPATLPKGLTRAYQRSKRPIPEVRTVRIKPGGNAAPSQRRRELSHSTRAKPDHRFWVSGHERQQAYGPGRSLRRPVDIQPFLKGDEGLPIKLSTTVRVLGARAKNCGTSTDTE